MSNDIFKELFEKVLDFFKGDYYKTFLWFITYNPTLGGKEPFFMIEHGRIEKLKKFIDSSLEGNRP